MLTKVSSEFNIAKMVLNVNYQKEKRHVRYAVLKKFI
jgi:hypothetical protein